jgi:Protein of unknown function (DUF973)
VPDSDSDSPSTASGTNPTASTGELEVKGVGRLDAGAALGLAGGVVGVVLPILFLWVTTHYPGGFFTDGSMLLDATALLVVAGSVLLLVSLFLYRRGFSALRKVDRRFAIASVLCVVGSLGFLLLLISAAVLLGSSSALVHCLAHSPASALSCVRSGQPLGAYTGLIGFWLGWLGGVGLVIGLSLAGRRYHSGPVSAGAALYAILLLVLIGPFLGLLTPVPGIDYLLLVVPFFIILAPGLVFGGARQALRHR